MSARGEQERKLPREPGFDSTVKLLCRPYDHVRSIRARLGGNAYETRLLLRRTVVLRGADAASPSRTESRERHA